LAISGCNIISPRSALPLVAQSMLVNCSRAIYLSDEQRAQNGCHIVGPNVDSFASLAMTAAQLDRQLL
jgi:hypothetical protein